MDDPFPMRGFQRLGDLPGNQERLGNGDGSTCDARVQTLAVHEFENEKLRAVRFVQTVDRAYVRMVERGEDLGFTTEPRKPFRIVRERVGQDFEGDVPSELGVPRAIDLAHAAGPKGGENLVRAKARAGLEGHSDSAGLYLSGFKHSGISASRTAARPGVTLASLEEMQPCRGTLC